MIRNNPRFPCPCTLGQARIDPRFRPLNSEYWYESQQGLVCYGPVTRNYIRVGWGWNLWNFGWRWKELKSQVNLNCFIRLNYIFIRNINCKIFFDYFRRVVIKLIVNGWLVSVVWLVQYFPIQLQSSEDFHGNDASNFSMLSLSIVMSLQHS